MKWCICILLLTPIACDPVTDRAVAALGGETPGVRPGPNHRPGQPCLLCHDGALGDPQAFSVAGTVYLEASGKHAAFGADVKLTAHDGSKLTLRTNRAGNFYVSPSRWNPMFPLTAQVTYQGTTIEMQSKIGRDGACAQCHVDPAGPDSPGHIYAVPPTDAGTP